MIDRLRWWVLFLVDVALCLVIAGIAGVVFGAAAAREDVRHAWRRPRSS